MNDKYADLLSTLEKRFLDNSARHNGLSWDNVRQTIMSETAFLEVIKKMEETGGEPDFIGNVDGNGFLTVIDCSPETPKARRGVCYDDKALAQRKENKPKDSAKNLAKAIGIEILDEDQYRMLQEFGHFDEKTSSWIKTPESIRELGGALFCDRRYGHIFTYHNSAESYYSARGFRGILRIPYKRP